MGSKVGVGFLGLSPKGGLHTVVAQVLQEINGQVDFMAKQHSAGVKQLRVGSISIHRAPSRKQATQAEIILAYELHLAHLKRHASAQE
jgi:hypothetical protein